MASLSSCSGDIDWLWGSLKPWQLLHSTLAERERNGSTVDQLDVWKLVNETLGANSANSIARDDEVQQEEADVKGIWVQGMRLLSDDGEYWRHGGVMESRVREWLMTRSRYSDEEEQELIRQHVQPINSSANHPAAHPRDDHFTASTITQYKCMSTGTTELAIAAACNTSSPVHQQYYDHEYCPAISQAHLRQRLTAHRITTYNAHHDSNPFCSDLESDTEGEENAAVIGDEDDDAHDEDDAGSAAAEDQEPDHANYEDNYALISSNYEDDDQSIDYNGVSCRLVVNQCCRAAAAAAAAVGIHGHGADEQVGGAKLGAARPNVEELEIEVCAVCLEKLLNNVGDGDSDKEERVQAALGCGHVFHRACIVPWLQRQPHACCPCCRAPISPAILAAPPNLVAPLHFPAAPPNSCMSGSQQQQQQQHDIMGLLADMEAALEHLGFRS